DPAAPDLIARRIDVDLGYGLSGPFVRRVSVDGVRLRGAYDGQGVHLGALDRLLPKSTGKAGLPDIAVSLADTEVALETPIGALSLAIAGDGNPARTFAGDARIASLALTAGGCAANDVAAVLKIATRAGKPSLQGPVRTSGVSCPGQKIQLGQGAAQIALTADAALERLTLDANVAGFGGRLQSVEISSMDGAITGSRSSTGFGATGRLNLKSLSAPALVKRIAALSGSADGTPAGPAVTRAVAAAARLLRRSDATLDLDLLGRTGKPIEVRLHRVTLLGENGARLEAIERGGLSWTAAGLHSDANITTSGGDLPTLALRLRQTKAGAPLTGEAVIQSYRAGAAQLTATPVQFAWDGQMARFGTSLTLDGPFSGGSVRALTLPVRGTASAAGALTLDPGCHIISFQQLQLTSFTFDAARLPVCGEPIVQRSAGGAVQIHARTGPLRLIGRTRDGAPVTLSATQTNFSNSGLAARNVDATLGRAGQQTHLAIDTLGGTIRNGRVGGRFAGTSGAIANVPLNLADAQGEWTLADGRLKLAGMLNVSDAETLAPRFRPLATDDATLGLDGGIITANATLREPKSRAEVTRVALTHDLSSGTGHATLDVPGITFVPKGLQPEQITPLTLGVIANVAGTVFGNGRIDWNSQGVTSSGDFATDRADFAAAFGPVVGLKGKIHFTDLLGLVTAPDQEATVAEINPGVAVTNGVVRYQLIGDNRVQINAADWPFAGGNLSLDPATVAFGGAERRLTFRIRGLDAAAFVQQLDFPNISATGTFDGELPMVFDQAGGRIEKGQIVARGGGTIAYVGELTNAQLGMMGKLAFDALKAIRYSSLDITLDGRLDGEMVSLVRFTGIREATPEQSLVTRLIRNLPFRFNIAIRAPFRGLVGSARSYIDPRLLLTQVPPSPKPTDAEPNIQPPASGVVR
ncbi:intermembrane phospholipid transport protein YdbH family protein, partial [Sphingomonas sp.]|uniref:YdbH domain-containing protein n=1 Tax=Sphingomonas sp. TaxID=28214 RepID=UPI003B3A1C1E